MTSFNSFNAFIRETHKKIEKHNKNIEILNKFLKNYNISEETSKNILSSKNNVGFKYEKNILNIKYSLNLENENPELFSKFNSKIDNVKFNGSFHPRNRSGIWVSFFGEESLEDYKIRFVFGNQYEFFLCKIIFENDLWIGKVISDLNKNIPNYIDKYFNKDLKSKFFLNFLEKVKETKCNFSSEMPEVYKQIYTLV